MHGQEAHCRGQASGIQQAGGAPAASTKGRAAWEWQRHAAPACHAAAQPAAAGPHRVNPFHTSAAWGQRAATGRSAAMAAGKSRRLRQASNSSRRSASFFHLSAHLRGREEGRRGCSVRGASRARRPQRGRAWLIGG
jgi:hypothetical protein